MTNATRVVRLVHFRFPNYWEEIVESVLSSDSALERLVDIEAEYVSREGEYTSAYFKDETGNALHIGLAGHRLMITYIYFVGEHNREYQYAIGNATAKGTVAFAFPEWSEVPKTRLISRRIGVQVIKEWIETGRLSDCVEWSYDLQ